MRTDTTKPATTSINIRISSETKSEAAKVFNSLNIPMSTAIGMFLQQVVMRRGLPFPVTLPDNMPNDITIKAIDEVENGSDNLKRFDNIDDFMEDLEK